MQSRRAVLGARPATRKPQRGVASTDTGCGEQRREAPTRGRGDWRQRKWGAYSVGSMPAVAFRGSLSRAGTKLLSGAF